MHVLIIEDVNEFENVSGHPRELTEEELKYVNGAWVANAVGAAVGGFAGAAGSYAAGGGWRGAAGGFVSGAISGAFSPFSTFGRAAVGFSVGFGSSYAGGMASAYF